MKRAWNPILLLLLVTSAASGLASGESDRMQADESTLTVEGSRSPLVRIDKPAVDPAAQSDAGKTSPETAFGFRLQEERAYVLGPKKELRTGEFATWSIRLVGLEGDGRERIAVFDLDHERARGIAGLVSNERENTINVEIKGRLKVNMRGFPLQLEFSERERLTGARRYDAGERRISYEYIDGKLEKTVRLGKREWTFTIGISSHSNLDVTVPKGLYLFPLEALHCLDYIERVSCSAGDPAFINPGLLSLVMPTLIDSAEGREDVLFFSPTAVGGSPLWPLNVPRWVSNERRALREHGGYFESTRLELGESETVEVGPRNMHAWALEVGRPVRKAYIDPDGKVLRIDIEPSIARYEDRWIRLRLASEF